MSARFQTAPVARPVSYFHRALAMAALAHLGSLAAAPRAMAQQEPAAIIAKTPDNAATGLPGRWDFGGTDIAYKAAKNELWVIDTYSTAVTSVNRFNLDDLTAPPAQTAINLPAEVAQAPVLGIAEIPNGAFKGKNLILVDPEFGTANPPSPQLGIYEDDGNLVAGEVFIPVENLEPGVQLSSIDVNPDREEIAAYDMQNHTFYILDSTFTVILGPISALGTSNGFIDSWFFGSVDRAGLRGAGAGIAYNGPDHLLVGSGFYNFWESHFVLEYDLKAGGAYSGRAIDLSTAGASGLNPDIAFVGIESANVDGEDILFAHNFGDDSIYAFTQTIGQHSPPVKLTGCGMLANGNYGLTWELPVAATIDSIRIIENGVEVATLAPAAVQFASPLPLLGKAFVEVGIEQGGLVSALRPVCQIENTITPELPNIQFDAAQITTLGNVLSGVAVTKLPATPDDFRGYVIGQTSNDIEVFDYQLNVIPAEKLILSPRVVTPGGSGNLAAIGIALYKLDGVDHIAVLDADGPQNDNVPSCGLYSLDAATRGQLVKEFDPIDLSALETIPFLFDWDTTPDNQFVAGGRILATGEHVIVRIRVDGDRMAATQMSPVPQRLLTPFSNAFLTGIGVSALPSGYLLVAGSDTFSKTYTEALLMTPFVDGDGGHEPALPKLVGFAQGLLLPNQFGPPFDRLGPGVGPDVIFGLDTAFFDTTPEGGQERQGVGVTYLPTGTIALIANPSTGQTLQSQGDLLLQGDTVCARPDLAAEQLADVSFELAAGQQSGTDAVGTSFAAGAATADYFLYVLNQSTTDSENLAVEVTLDGTVVPEASQKIVVPAGRYFRRSLLARPEDTLQVRVTNEGSTPALVRVITGAMGIGTVTPPAARFRRGDCDANGAVNITDAIIGLNWLFKSGQPPSCPDTADVDDDGKAGLTDMVVIVNYLFKAGPGPAAPGPTSCGVDPTEDVLETCVYSCE